MPEIATTRRRPRTGAWAGYASALVVLVLLTAPLSGTDRRSPQVPTATPPASEPVVALGGAPAWIPAVPTGGAVSGAVPTVGVTSATGAAAEPQTAASRSTATAGTAAAATATPAEQPTFLQADRWCSTMTLLSTSTSLDCPARSTTTDLWQADADAGIRGSSMFVSAAARAPAATIVATAQASATWTGRALRTSGEGGPVRVHLTGLSGGVEPTCSACAITAAASISIDVSYAGTDGSMVRQWSSCYLWSGAPVPAAVTVPDDCMPPDTIEVPPRTPIWVELRLDAYAGTGSGPQTSAALEVASATLDVP